MIHNCTRVWIVVEAEIKQTNDSPPPPRCNRQSVSKVIFLLNVSLFLIIQCGYLKDPVGAFPLICRSIILWMCTYKIVFNRGLTGVPRLFSIGLMGVSDVTWVTGRVFLFCFFFPSHSSVQFGSTVYRTQKFLFCENMCSYMLLGFFFFFFNKTPEFCITYCFTNPQPAWL